jgi:hypothetical protein
MEAHWYNLKIKLNGQESYRFENLALVLDLICAWLFQIENQIGFKILVTAAGNTKGEVSLLTSCLTGLESAVSQLTIFVFICKTD